MSNLRILGLMSLEGGEFPLAGVTVIAVMPSEGLAEACGPSQSGKMEIGRTVTDSDGSFVIEADDQDPRVARWTCALQHCREFKFQITCFDNDETLLYETEPLSYAKDLPIQIALQEPEGAPSRVDWEELGRRMLDSQLVRLDDIAVELATLAPRGLFRNWSVQRRLVVLGRLEQALLDPRNQFEQAGVQLRFWRLESDAEALRLREQLRREQRPDLLEALDLSVERARKIGSWADINSPADAERFKQGDYLAGVNRFIEQPELFPGIFGGFTSPTTGYRDYLRDRWADNQRIVHQVGGGDVEVAPRSVLFARLKNRFHQDFETHDTTEQPANRLLVSIISKILTAPVGNTYGFGLAAAAIPAQGEMSNRDYLDTLIALSGESLAEIEKRYRLNLRRSDLETSNPVQQNIETLQRFFTDSHQSVDDPVPVTPDRVANTPELLIIKFPDEAAGPFFLEYEEWLAREEPFYPENFYDPRATYKWTLIERIQKTHDVLWAHSIPIAAFLDLGKNEKAKFDASSGAYNHAAAKWQWVRNHVELWEVISDANNTAASLNYAVAEQKYTTALDWVTKLRSFATNSDAAWQYDPNAFAKAQKNTDVSTIEKLGVDSGSIRPGFEGMYWRFFGQHYDSSIGGVISDLLSGGAEISDEWWGKPEAPFNWPGNRRELRYLLDYLQYRYLPVCLSEVQLAIGKYADAVRQLIGPARFNVFAANPKADVFPVTTVAGAFQHFTDGPLPYATSSDRSKIPNPLPPTAAPSNRAEIGYFKLKLGNATLEWADALYRTNQPDSIMRTRELYKGVLFLHGEDPEITPTWPRRGQHLIPFPFPWVKSNRNPAIESQVNRARLGFTQINAGLNYYGASPAMVPPVRYRVLKEAADRFAAGARGAQSDFLNYIEQLDTLTVSEMQARTMVAKANAAMSIAQEQQKIAEFNVGEAQKQVDAINGQIVAKKAEIAKKDEFFEQLKDFAGGMKDSVSNLGELAFKGEGDAAPASSTQLSTGDILSLGAKVGTASNLLGGSSSTLAAAGGTAGAFGAFLYAGVSSMQSMADAINKRGGDLAQLQNVALPAAKALVDLKKRDVTIAQLSQAIAQADAKLGTDLLVHYAQRFLNRAFLVSMAEFSNRLMRRYLDLAGRTGWLAERALAFEQDRDLSIIAFDYFPRARLGVSGADLLQLHLAELEAARIQGLTQTIPVKQTISLAREFPVQFGQLKKTGACTFATSETPLRLVYPGVYGYRVRNVTIGVAYAAAIPPHRGLISNQGVSVVTRDKAGSAHTLVRFPDALPLSEFRMRDDMWVFGLPDETLLPFEGSGIETVWELMLSKVGNANGFEAMTDVFITFDMRASYSAFLEKQHIAALPNSANRSLLISGKAMNPGALPKFRKHGGKVTISFDLAKAAYNTNETQRKTLNFTLVAVGVHDAPFTATFSSTTPANSETITFKKGIALSNAGALSDGNGGVPLPLNTFVGLNSDQTFNLVIDAGANAGVDFTNLTEVLLLVEYEATF